MNRFVLNSQFTPWFSFDKDHEKRSCKSVGSDGKANILLEMYEEVDLGNGLSPHTTYYTIDDDEFKSFLNIAVSQDHTLDKKKYLKKLPMHRKWHEDLKTNTYYQPYCTRDSYHNRVLNHVSKEIVYMDNQCELGYTEETVPDNYGTTLTYKSYYFIYKCKHYRIDYESDPDDKRTTVLFIEGPIRIRNAFPIDTAVERFEAHDSITACTGKTYHAIQLCDLLCYAIDHLSNHDDDQNSWNYHDLFDIERAMAKNACFTFDFIKKHNTLFTSPKVPKDAPTPSFNSCTENIDSKPLKPVAGVTLFKIDFKPTKYIFREDVYIDLSDPMVYIYLNKDGKPYYQSGLSSKPLNKELFAYFVNTAYNNKIITKKQCNAYFNHKEIWDPKTPLEESAHLLQELFVKNSPKSSAKPKSAKPKSVKPKSVKPKSDHAQNLVSSSDGIVQNVTKKLSEGIKVAQSTQVGKKVTGLIRAIAEQTESVKAPKIVRSFAGFIKTIIPPTPPHPHATPSEDSTEKKP